MSAESPVLELRDLTVGYVKTPVVRAVNMTVARGEIVALVGLNGAGKTTILRAVVGELAPMSGEVRWQGRATTASKHQRIKQGMAYVADDRSVLMNLTVAQNLRLGRGAAEDVLELFPELARMTSRRAGSLSGGEQQMLSLGRALASKPDLLLIDELSLGLAPTVVKRLLATLTTAVKSGVGILLVEQQVRTALSVADRGYVLERGQIVDEGPAARLSEAFDTKGIVALTADLAGQGQQ